ncbi:hypothetical protein K431DRAFT_29180 [Polychaeton citri CBS 116435]|uniref:Uncharacterized protein n=1 Tax=Polychaeton citri CBS 116435 TaxID=1314669 RepID=A0A9P4QA15_9PEZI|nr:hypothetical protein K431DRAFT_29180 [Polychaeton citri CBS 116435]
MQQRFLPPVIMTIRLLPPPSCVLRSAVTAIAATAALDGPTLFQHLSHSLASSIHTSLVPTSRFDSCGSAVVYCMHRRTSGNQRALSPFSPSGFPDLQLSPSLSLVSLAYIKAHTPTCRTTCTRRDGRRAHHSRLPEPHGDRRTRGARSTGALLCRVIGRE